MLSIRAIVGAKKKIAVGFVGHGDTYAAGMAILSVVGAEKEVVFSVFFDKIFYDLIRRRQ